jgi:hypothetical protein
MRKRTLPQASTCKVCGERVADRCDDCIQIDYDDYRRLQDIERQLAAANARAEEAERERDEFESKLIENLEILHLHWRRKSVEHLNAKHHQAYKYAEGVKAGLAIALEELRLLAEAQQDAAHESAKGETK